MTISVLDGSSYLRGLLILIRKDKKISDIEKKMVLRIGKVLGFEKRFIEKTIREILDNCYVSETPPVFSSRELAEKFLTDGLSVATFDKVLHPLEEAWLHNVAKANRVEFSWLSQAKESLLSKKTSCLRLKAEELTVQY